VTPIYQTSTYVHDAVGVHKGYDYSPLAYRGVGALSGELAGRIAWPCTGMAATDTVVRC
jgi:hypothetical protein